jgi:hypothetical protein
MGGLSITSCLQLANGATETAGRLLLLLKLGILLVGLVIQMLRF